MSACSCSSLDCRVNGCAQLRRLMGDRALPAPTYAPMPFQGPGCQPLKQLSEADVRRIVAEEVGRAIADLRNELASK